MNTVKIEEFVDKKLEIFLKLPIDDQREHLILEQTKVWYLKKKKRVIRTCIGRRTSVIQKKKTHNDNLLRLTNSCGKEILKFS